MVREASAYLSLEEQEPAERKGLKVFLHARKGIKRGRNGNKKHR